MKKLLEKPIVFWQNYEHRLGVGALLVGFLFDLWVAKKPDSVVDNIILLSYLFIAASVIVILNIRTRRRGEGTAAPLLMLLMLQFCFGGLASNLLVLYGKSGTLAGSALFIALLICLVFGNEFLRNRYDELRFNIAVYYFLLLTYCVIAAPTFIFHAIGASIFLLSGLISLLVMTVVLAVIFFAVLHGSRRQFNRLIVMVAIIFSVFNGLYFLNIIPPVPLSLKDIGIYHSILKYSSGDYLGLYEPVPWWDFWQDTSGTFTYTPGESAYCFSAVYAPAALDAPIYHRWERYDQSSRSWVTVSRISFPISGGRPDGYRGFSTNAVTPGEWRCDIETSGGALIGRVDFTATEAAQTPQLSQATL